MGDPPDPADVDVVLELPDDLREALREPLGPVTTDVDRVRREAGSPLVSVGDIVTYRLEEAGRTPDVGIVDWRTQREAVDPDVADAIGDGDRRISATNPAGTLTASLLRAIVDALDDPPALIDVAGEEDLAALPAIVAVPDGASVCYGQPGEGTVHVQVDDAARERARDLLERMDGDHDRLWRVLGVDGREGW